MEGKSIVTFGEILLRLSTPGALRIAQSSAFGASFGGSEANVAVSLANFGHQVQYISRVPGNDVGRASLMALHRYGVRTDFVAFGGDRLGSYYMETAASMRSSKVVYDRADSAFTCLHPDLIDWDAAFAQADWFHWSGIAAALSASGAETCRAALEKAARRHLCISCDLNFRKTLWHYGSRYEDVIPPMLRHCDVLFGSEDEYEHVLGLPPNSFKAIRPGAAGYEVDSDMCARVLGQMSAAHPNLRLLSCGLRLVVNSNHHIYASAVFDGTNLFISRLYDVDAVVDCVGAGDAYIAALIHGLLHYADDTRQAMEFATAAMALKNTIAGDFNLVSDSEVEEAILRGRKL